MASNMYLFIISSLNHPIYRQIQQKRRHLLDHYKIPYTVLINHDESPLEDESAPTLVPVLEDEVFYNGEGYNPYMAQKFLTAVKMLFRSYSNFDDVPNYIVRINATVYVHYPSLIKTLNDDDFPQKRVLAGPNWNNVFVQGMVMVFSKDVLMNMLNDPRMYSKEIMKDNDDVSLSLLADPYSAWMDWNPYTCWYYRKCPMNKKGVYELNKIKPMENNIWIFRICEHGGSRPIDVVNWDNLLKYYHEYEIVAKHTTTSGPVPMLSLVEEENQKQQKFYVLVGIVLFIFLLVISAILIKDKKKKLNKVYENMKKLCFKI